MTITVAMRRINNQVIIRKLNFCESLLSSWEPQQNDTKYDAPVNWLSKLFFLIRQTSLSETFVRFKTDTNNYLASFNQPPDAILSLSFNCHLSKKLSATNKLQLQVLRSTFTGQVNDISPRCRHENYFGKQVKTRFSITQSKLIFEVRSTITPIVTKRHPLSTHSNFIQRTKTTLVDADTICKEVLNVSGFKFIPTTSSPCSLLIFFREKRRWTLKFF